VQYLQPTKEEPTSLQLNALVNPNEGGATTFHYEYGTTTGYGSSTPESTSIGSDSNFHEASQVIAGLSPGTLYHYRIVATGPGGPYEGEDQTFRTLPVPPTVADSTVTERSPTAATVNADVKPGFGPTVVYFEYGESPAYGSATIPGAPLAADNDSHPVSAKLSALSPDTTYHYKVVAINFNGSATSPDLTFTTGGTPHVSGESASNVTETTARLSAVVNPNLSSATYHIEYGPTSSYGSSTGESSPIGGDETNHSVNEDLAGLSSGTTYHYRVVATNAVGTTAGAEATFTTVTAKAGTSPPPPTLHCKKGFVKRHGKCVKRKKPKKRHGRRAASR
jgi:phosphodiesterase/alkaline phosphatase D-like protein